MRLMEAGNLMQIKEAYVRRADTLLKEAHGSLLTTAGQELQVRASCILHPMYTASCSPSECQELFNLNQLCLLSLSAPCDLGGSQSF